MSNYLSALDQRWASDQAELKLAVKTLQQQALQVASVPLGAWTAYTPAWSAPTPPVLNNGSLNGRYSKLGRLVTAVIWLQFGSLTTAGAGAWSLSLPAAAVPNTTLVNWVGSWWASGAASAVTTGVCAVTGSLILLPIGGATATGIDATHPFTWASGNQLSVQLTYESTS